MKVPDFSYKIKIHIEDESEIYNKFDVTKTTLSDELIDYINKNIELSATLQPLEFEVTSYKKIDEERFYKAFENTMDNLIKLVKKEKHANVRKQIWMGTIGVLFIGASISLSSIIEQQIILELISVIGSFSAWEATSGFLVESKELRNKERQLIKIDRGKVKFEYIE